MVQLDIRRKRAHRRWRVCQSLERERRILFDARNKINIFKNQMINDFFARIKVTQPAHKAGTPRVTIGAGAANLVHR
jgi:hypothetical protein